MLPSAVWAWCLRLAGIVFVKHWVAAHDVVLLPAGTALATHLAEPGTHSQPAG